MIERWNRRSGKMDYEYTDSEFRHVEPGPFVDPAKPKKPGEVGWDIARALYRDDHITPTLLSRVAVIINSAIADAIDRETEACAVAVEAHTHTAIAAELRGRIKERRGERGVDGI